MRFLFETSFEVCNKVGGIHTVVSSKVNSLKNVVDKHILFGPWFRDRPSFEFIQSTADEVPQDIQEIFNFLSKKGIFCTHGKWDISSYPEVVLIDFQELAKEENRNYLKKKYWDYFGVDSLNSNWDFDEPLCFSTAVGMFIEEYARQNPNNDYVAQFHEWMCGFGGLYLKAKKIEKEGVDVRTIFTTHATMLGRSLMSQGKDPVVLSKTKSFNPIDVAKECGVIEKYTTEVACAKYCDSFTTVSKITTREAKILLKADAKLTPNGIDLSFFKQGKELFIKQFNSRKRIEEILSKLFPNEDFSNSFLIYTSGRPEFHNKGFDVLLEAISFFNSRNEDVVCLFLVPLNHYEKVIPFDGISTHYIDGGSDYPLIKYAKELGLNNTGKTKVVLYPCYLGSEDDEYFGTPYYASVSGFDLGIFSSFYEPWGYTPLECIATGVPTITSNVTGFGDYVKSKKLKGIEIVEKNETEVSSIISIIKKYKSSTPEEKMQIAIDSINSSKKFEWGVFIKNYLKEYKWEN